ncbi:MAG: polysaccharide biosynthesis/export family protein, partial [Syntrophobacteraceae bacterium]
MRLRISAFLLAGLLVILAGCAGNQWDEHLVEGSNGPVPEIRVGSRVPSQAVEVGAVPDPQARVVELQDKLLKMSAMMPMQHYTDYQVGPEDALQVTFLGAGDGAGGAAATAANAQGGDGGTPGPAPLNNIPGQLSGLFRVNGQGEIRLMLVGNVKVAGLTPVQIAEKLTELYKSEGYLVNPAITVSVAEYRHSQVAVSGAVQKPGYYPLIGPRPLLVVLGMAGGLVDRAGDTVNIIRPVKGQQGRPGMQGLDAKTMVVNLNSLILKGDTNLDIPIQNGDVVFVPFAQSAYVIGAVKKPGNVPLQDNMTLTKAISMCQGKDKDLASNTVTVLRVGDNGQRVVIPVDLAK